MDYVKVNFREYIRPKHVYMVTGDTARWVRVIPEDVNLSGTVSVEYRRPDGTSDEVPAVLDEYGAAVAEADAMIEQEGTVMCMLKVVDGGKTIRSFPFFIISVAD